MRRWLPAALLTALVACSGGVAPQDAGTTGAGGPDGGSQSCAPPLAHCPASPWCLDPTLPQWCDDCFFYACPGGCAGCGDVSVVASDPITPLVFAVDGNAVYWAASSGPSGGAIKKLPKAGGPAITLAELSFDSRDVDSIVLDATRVYWSGVGEGVFAAPKAGGPTVVIASGPQTSFQAVTLDDTNVYYYQFDPAGGPESVMRSPKAGGTAVALVTGPNVGAPFYALQADATSVYYQDGTTLRKVPSSGGTAMPLVTGFQGNSLQVVGSLLFWTDFGIGVMRMSAAGGAVDTFASGSGIATALASDGTNVYWGDDFAVMTAPVAGGPSRVVAKGAVSYRMAVDDTYVYWAASQAVPGALEFILKAPK